MSEHTCGYQSGTENHCNQPIYRDDASYSGWSHIHSADWFHWASPTPYQMGLAETQRIFMKCVICGKLPEDNPDHIRVGGHRFKAQQQKACGCVHGDSDPNCKDPLCPNNKELVK